MINCNGTLLADNDAKLSIGNRGFAYGDAVFETIRVNQGNILFWEDHYFRLMSSMRILRMQIPSNFTPEFLQQEILDIISANELLKVSARVKLVVNRVEGGLYTPEHREVEYVITTTEISSPFYTINDKPYIVTLFKDHYVAPDLLSTIKSTNKVVNVLAGIFAQENDFDSCLLVNTNKMVLEALNGNLFLVKGNAIKTPPLADGCLKGILRTQLLRILKDLPDYEVIEDSISPFELQKADELFITNVIQGIQPVSKFRKKEYDAVVSRRLLGILNTKIRLEDKPV